MAQGNIETRPDNEADAVSFLRPRKRADDDIDMTPMIDCVFLLLIFFITTFQADPAKGVPLPIAKFGNPILGVDSVFISVAAGEGNTPRVYLGDQMEPSLLARSTNQIDQEQEIIDYVKRGIDAGKRQVIVKGDGALTAGQVDLIYKAVGKALEGQTLHIAVTSEGK
jgi:biopolymer transport protein TolR